MVKSEPLHIRLTRAIHEELEQEARALGVSKNSLVRIAVADFLRKSRRKAMRELKELEEDERLDAVTDNT